jgi:hypothetical protein
VLRVLHHCYVTLKGDAPLLLQAAVDMMRKVLNTINMDGIVVIGEGEKDEVWNYRYLVTKPKRVLSRLCS